MKTTTTIILFSAVCFLFGFCETNNAQHPKEQSGRWIEQSINGQTYVYDTLRCIMQNKKNHLETVIEPHHCDFGVRMIKSYKEIFDKVFSEERTEELKGKVLPMFFYCDSDGNILEIGFIIGNVSITLQEVNALENEFLKYKAIEIRNACPENKYYSLMTSYRWPK